ADGQGLEVAVAVGLDVEDRRRPAVLARLDDLVVPVGALDETHDERGGPRRRAGPIEETVEQLAAVAQVGLQDDPGARPGAELLLGEELADEFGDRLARVERLHVDVQVRVELGGEAQEAAQARGGVALAALGGVGAQQGSERADLDREVGAGEAAAGVLLEGGAGGQPRVDLGERAERVGAALRVAVGLGGGDGGLAEEVDRRRDAVVPEVAEHLLGAAWGLGDDEPVGHVPHAGGGRGAQRLAPGAAVAHPHRHGERRRPRLDLLEEAGQVGGEVVQGPAGGDDVDEAEERRAQLVVLGGAAGGVGVADGDDVGGAGVIADDGVGGAAAERLCARDGCPGLRAGSGVVSARRGTCTVAGGRTASVSIDPPGPRPSPPSNTPATASAATTAATSTSEGTRIRVATTGHGRSRPPAAPAAASSAGSHDSAGAPCGSPGGDAVAGSPGWSSPVGGRRASSVAGGSAVGGAPERPAGWGGAATGGAPERPAAVAGSPGRRPGASAPAGRVPPASVAPAP